MNIYDYIVIALLLAWAAFAFIYMRRQKKSGKGCLGCSGNCSSCSHCRK